MAFVLHSPIVILYLKEPYTVFLESKNLILFFVFRLNICTSKVLDFLLPLGAKGAGEFESYTTSEIPDKYNYDAF